MPGCWQKYENLPDSSWPLLLNSFSTKLVCSGTDFSPRSRIGCQNGNMLWNADLCLDRKKVCWECILGHQEQQERAQEVVLHVIIYGQTW